MTTRILIVGGGIGGLTLAALLERRAPALEVTLVERTPAWAPVGAGISLTGNALRKLSLLGIVPELEQRGVSLESLCIADAQGRVLSSAGSEAQESGRDEFTNKVIAIHRAELHEVLLSALGSTQIRLGMEPHELVESDDGVSVTFLPAEGASENFDLVVGADGVSSRVRAEVVPQQRSPFRYAGYTCWRSVLSMNGSELTKGRTAWELWGRGSRFGALPVGGGRVYFYACVNAPERDPEMLAIDQRGLVDLFSDFSGPVPEVLAAVDQETRLHHDDLGDVRLERWSRGCFVLLGDAAHATTPNMGQGAAMAIEDAVVLSDELARAIERGQSLRPCLSSYEMRRRARVDRLQLQARRLGNVAQWHFAPAVWLRNRLVAATPSRTTAAQLRKVVDEPI